MELALEFRELSTPVICAYVGKCFGKFLQVWWRGGYNRSTGVYTLYNGRDVL